MLAASAYAYPFPPPHLQAGYQPTHNAIQLSDVDRQREQQRKRTYLSLLPPAQIIEICLNFEQYVPLHVRPSVWPADLDAAILALQKTSTQETAKVDPPVQQQLPPPPTESTPAPSSGGSADVASQEVRPPGNEQAFAPPVQPASGSFPTPSSSADKQASSPSVSPPIIAHVPERPSTPLSAPTEEPSQPTGEQTDAIPEASSTPAPTAAETPPQPEAQPTSTSQTCTPIPQVPQPPSQTHTPTPQPPSSTQTSATTPPVPTTGTPQPPSQVATPLVPGAYPYAAYGFALQQPYAPAGTTPQAAYPHAPYYPPPGTPATGYTPYASYPAFAPPQHAFQPPPTTIQHTQPQPPPAPPPSGEDLPSYEDMIVEALSEIGDPEGAAPKDIFTWIGGRWPLQMNFRPSASQALQKAFKRGRLEKQAGGKYRLNSNWEGGATSRRTTRRPQTLAQTTYALHHGQPLQQNPSPFTHAPLPHRAHTSPPPPAPPPQHTPYPGYPYAYPSYGYPSYSYNTQPTSAASKTTTSVFKNTLASLSKTATKTIPSGKEKEPATDEGDAWEAAQHILQAINFGSLQHNSQSAPDAHAASSSAAPPPIMASLDFSMNGDSSSANAVTSGLAPGDDTMGRATLTDEERASLQAQLALLAAQLSEIASGDDDDDVQESPPVPTVHQDPQQRPLSVPPQHEVPAAVPPPMQPIIMDVNQFPEESFQELALQYPAETAAAASGSSGGESHGPSVVPQPTPQSLIPATSSFPTPPVAHSLIPQLAPQPSLPPQPQFAAAFSFPLQQPPPDAPSQLPQPLLDQESAPEPELEAMEESDEDEDMEMVDVDSFMRRLQG